MRRKHILIFQTGEPIPCDKESKRKMRAWNLVDYLLQNDCYVTLVSTRFDHSTKEHRSLERIQSYHNNLEIFLIDSPGYNKNISLRRLYDHLTLSKNLASFLKKIDVSFDAVFIGFPPLEAAFVLFRWSKRNNLNVFLDVKDLWPQIFLFSRPPIVKFLLRILLTPYFIIYNYLVKNTDYLVSISKDFIDFLVKDTNRKSSKNIVTFLTSASPSNLYYSYELKERTLTLGFAGSFMDAFDFLPIKEALDFIGNDFKVKLLIAGTGGAINDVKKTFHNYSNVIFLGWLDGDQLDNFYNSIDISLIPLKQRLDFSLSFPNKAMDSLSRHKPIICSCKGALTNYLEKYDCGYYFNPNNPSELAMILNKLDSDRGRLQKMSLNISKIYEKNFNHNVNYENLVAEIISSNQSH